MQIIKIIKHKFSRHWHHSKLVGLPSDQPRDQPHDHWENIAELFYNFEAPTTKRQAPTNLQTSTSPSSPQAR
jgi:hypothetical protein